MDPEESPGLHEASEALNSGLSASCDLQILHSGRDPSHDYDQIKKEVCSIRPRDGCPDWLCCECCPTGLKSSQLSVVCYVITGTLTVTSSVLLVTFGICLVAPYVYVLKFEPTMCESVEYLYAVPQINCDCREGQYEVCESSYPCLKVYVQFDLPNNETVYTQMFESEFELRGNECSFIPQCKSDKSLNEDQVKAYRAKWAGDQQPFPCLYHTNRNKEVIRQIHFNKSTVLHLMLWPTVLAVLFAVGAVLTFKVYGCRDCKICINRIYRTVVLCEHHHHSDWGK